MEGNYQGRDRQRGLCQKKALNHQIFIDHGNKDFFTRLATGYKSWIHFHTPEKKSQSMQWKQHRHYTTQKISLICMEF